MYLRVIPRDLFNEASLLKCLGQLYLCLEKLQAPGVDLEHDGEAFEVRQSDDDGSINVSNVLLSVRGEEMRLHRPLNSRQPWPLYLTTSDDEEFSVFNDDGTLTSDFLGVLHG